MQFRLEFTVPQGLSKMNAYSAKTIAILKPQNRFLVQRKEIVDRLSAVGDRLGISN